ALHVLGFVEARLLRHETDLDAVGRPGAADEVLVLRGHDAEQAALAGAVAADDADLGARIQVEPDVLQHLALAVRLAELLNRKDVLLAHALLAGGSFILQNRKPTEAAEIGQRWFDVARMAVSLNRAVAFVRMGPASFCQCARCNLLTAVDRWQRLP